MSEDVGYASGFLPGLTNLGNKFGLRFVFIFLCLNFCNLSANDIAPTETQPIKKESSSLQGEDSFVIYYVFADKDLENPLKEIMVTSLKKIGTVYPGDDSKLSQKEKEDRVKKGGMLEIVFTSLVEENPQDPSKATTLPVVELSFKVLGAVDVLKSGSKQVCAIWEKEKFIGTTAEKKEMNEKVIKTFEIMMNEFIQSYQKANSSSDKTKVKFFLYA